MSLDEFTTKIEGMDLEPYKKQHILEWVKEIQLPGRIVHKVQYVPYKVITKIKPVAISDAVLQDIWWDVWPLYMADYLPIKTVSRYRDFTAAKTHFARLVKMLYPEATTVQIAKFMGKDHTTVLHYWYKAGYNCQLPPINDIPKSIKQVK